MTSCVVRRNHDDGKELWCKEGGDIFRFFESFLEPFSGLGKTRKDGGELLEARSGVVQGPVPLTKVVAKRVSEVILLDNVIQREDPSLEAAKDQCTVAWNIVCSIIAFREVPLFALTAIEKGI